MLDCTTTKAYEAGKDLEGTDRISQRRNVEDKWLFKRSEAENGKGRPGFSTPGLLLRFPGHRSAPREASTGTSAAGVLKLPPAVTAWTAVV